MIAASETFQFLLAGGARVVRCRVESWLGTELLDDDVPVITASEETDLSLSVPERVTLSVPRRWRNTSYGPVEATDTLAAQGQRLRVLIGLDTRRGAVEWIQRGWFVIQDATPSDDQVTVTATGLLTLIDEAKLIAPWQPTGTFGSTLRGLLEPALTVDLTGAPADRSVPSSITFDEDRLAGVYELLDAWPATGRVDADGVFRVSAPDTEPSIVLTMADNGYQATVLADYGASTREGAYNCVVSRGTAADGGVVQGVAYDTTSGPRAYGGAFNPLPVPYFFSSPLLTTVAQCNASSATVLARLQREAADPFDVEAIPHYLLQAGDRVQIYTTDRYASADIQTIRLPYTADGGAMRLGLRTVEAT